MEIWTKSGPEHEITILDRKTVVKECDNYVNEDHLKGLTATVAVNN
jgi:hypothetical protein